MDARRITADLLERDRDELIEMMKFFPLEVLSPMHADTEDRNRFRVVVRTEEEFNKLIHQLRAEKVSKEEALDPTLVLF